MCMDITLSILASNFDGFKASLDECDLNAEQAKDTEEILSLAKKELSVFPFNNVKKRWLKLYTDVRLLRAQESLAKLLDGFDLGCENQERLLSDAVAELDYALIVAGGGDKGRRELIQRALASLSDVIVETFVAMKYDDDDDDDDDDEERPRKRRRMQDPGERKQLSSDLSPVPAITTPVHRLSRPSLTQFDRWVDKTSEPLLLEGILDHWPALQNWKDPDYWLVQTLGGRRLVPVEIGQSYHDEDWRQQIMPFRDFLDRYIRAIDTDREEVGYLAQHDLFGQIETLRKDFAIPDFCYCEMSDGRGNAEEAEPEVHQNVWFGGRTVSPLHHDLYHNILCQVHGTKYIRLYSPEFTSQLYPRSKKETAPHVDGQSTALQENISATKGVAMGELRDNQTTGTHSEETQTIDMSNNSSLDIFAMEMSPHEDWDEIWPGISEVPFFECILHEGEALYIPKGWWHYVRGLSSSGISISFWW